MIISASRRTDIPAFHAEWFMNRVREGFCLVANPFNPKNVTRVSLAAADVDVIVFWSKNPAPLFPFLEELDSRGYRYYFLYTLNPYPASIEPGVPPLEDRIETFRALALRIGRQKVVWRYDPIILSRVFDAAFHRRTFAELAQALRGSCNRVIISLLDFYRKTERRMSEVEKETGDAFIRDIERHHEIPGLLAVMADIAHQSNMEIQTCCEAPDIASFGVPSGKCIDDKLIRSVFGIDVTGRKDPGQRKNCRCAPSKDIGSTDSCLHGCRYCYATNRPPPERHCDASPKEDCTVG